MSNPNDEVLRDALNQRLKIQNLSKRYDYVKVLVLYWDGQGTEIDAFRKEGQSLAEFFRHVFNYPVQEFAISSSLSQLKLQEQITAEFISASSAVGVNTARSLLIIHYGGHGDEDTRGGKRAVWVATAEAKPNEETIVWSEIQHNFASAKADILLLLDCCNAAQAARERRKSASSVELLAAAAMGAPTKQPGNDSFTFAMMRAMEHCLETNGHVAISDLASRLAKSQSGLPTSPIHYTLWGGDSDRVIRLEPKNENISVDLDIDPKHEEGYTVHLLFQTTSVDIDDLRNWLHTDLPSTISMPRDEKIVQKTTVLNSFVKEATHRARPLAKILDKDSFNDIMKSWIEIQDLFQQSKHQRRASDADGGHTRLFQRSIDKFLTQLEACNDDVAETIERRALQSPAISDHSTLDNVINDPTTGNLGIREQLQLFQLISSKRSSSDLGPVALRTQSENSDERAGTLWKEFKIYGRYTDPADIPQVENRVALLAELLGASKSPAFRSLNCCHWYHEPEQHRFVLEFDIPPGFKTETGECEVLSLKQVIRDTTGPQRPTLGQRLNLAFLLAKAVHKVALGRMGAPKH